VQKLIFIEILNIENYRCTWYQL